jgi:hypothetical protein
MNGKGFITARKNEVITLFDLIGQIHIIALSLLWVLKKTPSKIPAVTGIFYGKN